MRDREFTSAPDYTTAALTMLGVNLIWIFVALWAAVGLVPVLLLAASLNHLISRKAMRQQAPARRT